MNVKLNEDQEAAERAIFAAYDRKEASFLLIGSAGVGKTTLMQSVCDGFWNRELKIVVTAPTHKAVAVLRRKLDEAGLQHIESMTIHSLLALKPTVGDSDKQVLKPNPHAESKAGLFDVVVIDESSMVDSQLQYYIYKLLKNKFVLYVGDAAQLPPVGEDIAPCFKQVAERNTFALTKIVRQAEGNPILKAAGMLRAQQEGEAAGKAIDWAWTAPAVNEAMGGGQGIYHSGEATDEWLHQAFTSDEFKADNDAYRYIAYTNHRVKEVNRKIRGWIYGETLTPFVEGERVLCRNPVLGENENLIFSTNEEAIVISIEPDVKRFEFGVLKGGKDKAGKPLKDLVPWRFDLPVWKMRLKKLDGSLSGYAYIPCDEYKYQQLDRKIAAEGKANRGRWREYFAMKDAISDIRPVYAMTAHSSQGSTFGIAFLDVADIATRARMNLMECKKLFYVGLTRASKAVVIV